MLYADNVDSETLAPHRFSAVEESVQAIKRWEQAIMSARSKAEQVSDWIASTAASGPVLALHVAWFGGWVAANIGLIRAVRPFDPFPFPFLTMTVSLEAIFLAHSWKTPCFRNRGSLCLYTKARVDGRAGQAVSRRVDRRLSALRLMYRILPSVRVAWRDVWRGAFVTALLFTIGKYLIGCTWARPRWRPASAPRARSSFFSCGCSTPRRSFCSAPNLRGVFPQPRLPQ